ncbi:GNAT family N-acetyltransferase [Methylocapsa acidiphila]|uniref:GNAT family N-acetyltransferase n=1 Tax=Methylocapsa acidiphila TaxID=133552 RepID=UPI0003F848C5|nr:GNAT family N-acetyltransferase [Methylocapsa acidiphila]
MARRIGPSASPRIRPARLEDLAAILAIEAAVFDCDQLSRRNLRYYLTSGTAILLVLESDAHVIGYSLVSFRRNSTRARLFSLALDPSAHGCGLGRLLLAESERVAKARGALALRLEVRIDNAPAIKLYQLNGYRGFAMINDYYQDGAPALRFEKALASGTG